MYLDGGCTVAADLVGNVHAMWHAAPLDTLPGTGEKARTVYVATSHDEGQTFAAEAPSTAASPGVFGCYSMRASAIPGGEIFAIYRSADGQGRGMKVMRSSGQTQTFTHAELQPWPINTCPMSSSFLMPTPHGMLATWETESTIWMTNLSERSGKPTKISAKDAKHPSLAQNELCDTLITQAIGTGWQRGGTLAWVVQDASGKILEQTDASLRKSELQVPVWSYSAAAYVKGQGFVLVH
jgi:hypothetical protein